MATLKGPITWKKLVLMKAKVLLLLFYEYLAQTETLGDQETEVIMTSECNQSASRKRDKAFPVLDPYRQGLIKTKEVYQLRRFYNTGLTQIVFSVPGVPTFGTSKAHIFTHWVLKDFSLILTTNKLCWKQRWTKHKLLHKQPCWLDSYQQWWEESGLIRSSPSS